MFLVLDHIPVEAPGGVIVGVAGRLHLVPAQLDAGMSVGSHDFAVQYRVQYYGFVVLRTMDSSAGVLGLRAGRHHPHDLGGTRLRQKQQRDK